MATNKNSGDNISKESEESSDSELSGSELDVSSDKTLSLMCLQRVVMMVGPNIGRRWGGLQF